MSATDDAVRYHSASDLHEIRVQANLDGRWAAWVEGLSFTHEADGSTTLTGPLADQAALHGVLNRMRDLGIAIISVRRLDAGEYGTVDQPQSTPQEQENTVNATNLRTKTS